MGIVAHTDYVAGTDVTAEGQNANENAIINEINGNLDNSNIKASAAIDGTKLADAPSGVTTAKINDLAVTEVKLAALAVAIAKLKKTTYSHASSIVFGLGITAVDIDTGLAIATTLPIALYLNASVALVTSMFLFQNAGTWRVRVVAAPSMSVPANALKIEYLT